MKLLISRLCHNLFLYYLLQSATKLWWGVSAILPTIVSLGLLAKPTISKFIKIPFLLNICLGS